MLSGTNLSHATIRNALIAATEQHRYPTDWSEPSFKFTVDGFTFQFEPAGSPVAQTALMIEHLVKWLQSLDAAMVEAIHRSLIDNGEEYDSSEDMPPHTLADLIVFNSLNRAIIEAHDRVIAEHGDWPESHLDNIGITAVKDPAITETTIRIGDLIEWDHVAYGPVQARVGAFRNYGPSRYVLPANSTIPGWTNIPLEVPVTAVRKITEREGWAVLAIEKSRLEEKVRDINDSLRSVLNHSKIEDAAEAVRKMRDAAASGLDQI